MPQCPIAGDANASDSGCIHYMFFCRVYAVGPFQSDALLVPDHCVFDHVHDQKQCTSYRAWNDTATASCVNRAMTLRSFSMLQPCGIDRFSGVEFVCCPHRDTSKLFSHIALSSYTNCRCYQGLYRVWKIQKSRRI